MLELISIIAAIALIIITPIQTAQIVAGKFSPKMKVTPEAFVTAFQRQVTMLMWLGAVFAVLNLVLAFLPGDDPPGENLFKFLSAALWAGVCCVSAYSRSRLGNITIPPGPAAPAG